MPIDATATKNSLADAYKALAAWMSAFTAMGSAGSAGTEPSGGTPTYARKAISWGSSSGGVVSGAQVNLDIPSGTTVVGVGFHTAVTAGTYVDKTATTSQAFSSQGTYGVTPTYTQT